LRVDESASTRAQLAPPPDEQQAPERELDALLLAGSKQQGCGSKACRF
jgi:hypothetical protein